MVRFVLSLIIVVAASSNASIMRANDDDARKVTEIINKVNRHWQHAHPEPGTAFWHNAVYHTGNMEAWRLTGDTAYYEYSVRWAEHNLWMGTRGTDQTVWKYSYGETDDYVLFGDWQVCFQTYADLYSVEPAPVKIARAREVMEYEMSTQRNDYWWWADGLYMVMPVMTKLYNITGNKLYLDKLYEYWAYADSLMFDKEARLYYRDARYVYPKHKTSSGKKDFWARGDGWAMAAFAKVLQDLPEDNIHRSIYINRYKQMASAVADCQQPEDYWTRSMLDPDFAPGAEPSGTAFFTYALMWGVNNGLLDGKVYIPVIRKAWTYLTEKALQPDGTVGYVQPIGDRAVPGQVIDAASTADFGVGAFLLAACEVAKYCLSK